MKDLNPYLQQYKSQIIFATLLLASVCVIFFVLVPQISSIGSLSQDMQDVSKKLTITKRSVQVLSAQNKDVLDRDFETVTTALPPEKDITAIYTALVDTAGASGVSFEGFTVQVGDVYSKKKIPANIVSGTGSPALSVSAKFGNVNQNTFAAFAGALANEFPLSEITKVEIQSGAGTAAINFFYKPYDLAVIGRQDVVPEITSQEKLLIDKLAKFNQ